MTIKEYEKLLPHVNMEEEDQEALEFFLNEFISNDVGTCELDKVKEYFKDHTVIIDSLGQKTECKNIEELVLQNYVVYKQTVDNPLIQDTLPEYDAIADFNREKKHAEFFKKFN